MFKYLDKIPERGDIVERITASQEHPVGFRWICGRPYAGNSGTRPSAGPGAKTFFKVMATKPPELAEVGDMFMSLEDVIPFRAVGSIHEIVEISTTGLVDTYRGFKYIGTNNQTTTARKHANIAILVKATNTETDRATVSVTDIKGVCTSILKGRKFGGVQ